MNILQDDIANLAESIKFRLMANKVTLSVFANAVGDVRIDRTHDARRRYDLPDADLVGVYTVAAKCADIADDLQARAWELLRKVA